MERKRRLGAFVLVDRVEPEPVAAAAGREVVERLLEAVSTEEPSEGMSGPDPVARVARDREGGKLGLDEAGGVDRLLVARARAPASLRLRPPWPDRRTRVSRPYSSPSQRSDSSPVAVTSARPRASPPTISACDRRALS